MPRFAHILNCVSETENPSLYELQQLTLAALAKAKKYTNPNIHIEQLVCHHKSQQIKVSPDLKILAPLEKSILDLGSFNTNKALPLLKDILEAAYKNSEAEYIIYSNADIGLMPQFYNVVDEYIKSGHDALVINRRRIKSTLNKVQDLDAIYSEVGFEHPGYDLFVFKRDLFPKFILNNMCIGVPFVGNDLFYNLFCFADKPLLLSKQHLTFHIGLELVKDWGGNALQKHNYTEYRKTTKALLPHMDISKFPGAELGFFKRHLKWLMNPTISYPEMCITDIKQLGKPRPKKVYDPNYKKQSYYEWLMKYITFD